MSFHRGKARNGLDLQPVRRTAHHKDLPCPDSTTRFVCHQMKQFAHRSGAPCIALDLQDQAQRRVYRIDHSRHGLPGVNLHLRT